MSTNNSHKPGGRARTAIAWLCALAALAMIFWFSTAAFSSDHTARFFGDHNRLARDCAHVAEYAALFLVLRWASSKTFRRRTDWFHAPVALFVAVLYAVTDEWHQIFVPGRTASVGDIGLDALGAVLGLALWYVLHRYRTRRTRDAR
jgi:VanZ family protein